MITFNKKIKNISILGLFLLSSLFLTSFTIENDATILDQEISKSVDLKASGFWSNFTFIHVKNNWTDFPIIIGDGSWSNPYTIENLTIDATTSPTGSGILIEDSKDVYIKIKNCTIINWGGGAYDGGIVLLNSSNGYLEKNYCSGGASNGIVLNGGLTGTCSNNTLYNNIIDNNGIRGIRITDYASGNWVISNKIRGNNRGIVCFDHASNNTIKHNNITGNTRGIDFQTYSDNNIIEFNNISDNGYGIYFKDYCDDNIIHHNLISENTNDGIYLWSYNDLNYIAYNNITDNYIGIHLFEYCDDNTIQNNNVSYNGLYGIQLEFTCFYNNIENNTANYNFGVLFNNAGILLYNYCDFNNVTHNTVIGNDYFGIWMLSGSDSNLINNNTVNNHDTGINIQSSDSNTVFNNTITLSTTDGVNVHVNTAGNIIKKNTIDNDQWGIHLDSNADTTAITENLIINNVLRGIYIEDVDCENNEVWLNSFINNGVNAQDSSDSGDNSWDKGGNGNYWDDYGGDDSNDDGIGDTPYGISGTGGNQDNFPIWEDGDDIYPTMIRNSPSPPFIFGANAPTFNLTIFDVNLHMAWYKLNDTYIHFFTPVNGINIIQIDQTSWDTLAEGNFSIGFFINDTSGNLLTMGLTASKELPPEEPPSTPEIPFGNYFMIYGIIAIVTVVILKKRKINLK